MHLQWHEIRARVAKFSEDWKLATRESADKHTFCNEFFESSESAARLRRV